MPSSKHNAVLPILQDAATTPETQPSQISGYGDGALLTPIINKEVSHIQSMIVRQRQPKSKNRRRPAPSYSNYEWPSGSRSFSPSSWSQSRKPVYASDYRLNCGGYYQQQSPPSLFKSNLPSKTSQSQATNSGYAGTSQSQATNFGYAGTSQSQATNFGYAGTSQSQATNFGYAGTSQSQATKFGYAGTSQSLTKNSCSTATSPPQPMKAKTEEFFLPPLVTQKLLQIVRDDHGQSVQKFEASVVKQYPYISGIFPNIKDLIQSLKSVVIIGGCVFIANETASGSSEQAPRASERDGHRELKSSTKILPAGMELDSDEERLSLDFNDALSAKVEGVLPAPGETEHVMSDVLKKRLTDVINCYPSGIWCSMLPDFFQKFHRVELDVRGSGFTNIVEMLKSCPELFVCIQDKGNWKVCNAKGYWTDSDCISDKIKENIKQLLVDKQNGVDIDKFADLYERTYLQRFDHIEMRFDNIDDLFLSINNIVIKMRREGNRFVIYPLQNAEDIKVAEPKAVSIAPAVHSDSGIMRLIPSDCVRLDYEFPKLVMPEGIKPDTYLNVLIAAVSNLDNFYVHIHKNSEISDLDDLTDDMLEFYQVHKQKYRMPPEAIVPGIIGVTMTFGAYCRCIISSEKNSEVVTVVPIDYGCTASVKKSGLMFLHKDFAQLPPQAISCRCANLQPPFNEKAFKRRAAVRFLELVKDKVLSANVAQFDKQRNFLAVSLIDTTGEDDVHINDVLCSEGLATFRLDAMITDLPILQHCIKWEAPSQSQPLEEPKPAPLRQAEVKTRHQINELQQLQKIDQQKLPQQFEVPKWSGQIKEVESPLPFMGPPPGFSALPKSQVRNNLARARDPPDTRLFPDLTQLMSVTHLTQGEPANADPSPTTLVPSLASLQESSYKVQELEANYAQQGGLSQTDDVLSPQESKEAVIDPVDKFCLDELQPAIATTGAGNRTFTERPVAQILSSVQQKSAIPAVELLKFGPSSSLVGPNYVDSRVAFDMPRTVQVEFLSAEDFKPKDPKLPSPPPKCERLGSPIKFIESRSIPLGNPNYHFPSTFQVPSPFQCEIPNYVPTHSGGKQNPAMFYPPFHYGINPPGFPRIPSHAFNPLMYRGPFVNSGVTFFPPQPSPAAYRQEPYQSFQQFLRVRPNNSPNQRVMSGPSYSWAGQEPDTFLDYAIERKKLTVPPKKILEIRSPTSHKVQNIPLAANLSDEVKESLATSSSNPGKANINLSTENARIKNASESTPESDCADSSFEESRNEFSQSISPLKNDLVDEGRSPIGHGTRAREISHTFEMTSDGMERDSLDEEEQDGENSEDLGVSLNSLGKGSKDDVADNVKESDSDDTLESERDESLMEADSSEEYEDSEVCPRSSTPLPPVQQEISGSLEQQLTNSEGILAEQVISEPESKNTTMDPKQKTVSKQRRFISTIDVAGKPMHVFWIEGHPYLEVELILGIGKLRPPVALKIVKTKSINKKLYELKAKTNPDIFDEMVELGICHVNHLLSANAKTLLVKLYDVSELLSSINVSDASYMKELHTQVYLHSIE